MSDAFVFPDWPAPAGVRAVVTTRQAPGKSRAPFDACNLGTRCGDEPAEVAANRVALAEALALPSPPRWLRQVHGTHVVDLDTDTADDGEPEADAACTRSTDCVLAILTADCLPVLFCSADGTTLAAAHAGWRGLATGVLESTLARCGLQAATTLAWLGPAIASASYEVGEEVRAAFCDRSALAAVAFSPTRPGHWQCDLYALARQRLAAAGLSRVYGGGFDTAVDPRFYSYRRTPATGRFATLLWRSAAG